MNGSRRLSHRNLCPDFTRLDEEKWQHSQHIRIMTLEDQNDWHALNPDSQRDYALHCINCDHECGPRSTECCECGIALDIENVYDIRPADYYCPPKDRIHYEFRIKDLSIELRLLIWNFALPGPRIICLETKSPRSFVCTRVYTDRFVISHEDGQTYAFEGDVEGWPRLNVGE